MAAVDTRNNPECSICCETFRTPKMLICGHTFCLDCLERYIGDRTKEFSCPVCRKAVKIPKGGAKDFPTNYALIVTTPTSRPKHRCSHHSDREVEFYCQTCEEGVCARCMYLLHKDHESLDIHSDDIRSKAIEEVLNLIKDINRKIKDLEKTSTTLQEVSEKLYRVCEEECSKVTEYTQKMIAELRRKCEKTRSTIRRRFAESQQLLIDVQAEVDNHVKIHLPVDLESKIPPLTDDSCLTILQALQELGKISDSLTISLPEITYPKWEEPCDFEQSGIKQLVYKIYCLPQLVDFKFSIDDIKDFGVYYDSKYKYTVHGVVLSCVVQRSHYGNLGIYIALEQSDNPSIANSYIESRCKILSHSGNDSREIIMNHCFTTNGMAWGCDKYISWKKLTDKQNGYINEDNQFIVQFDITDVKDVRMKTS